MERVRTVTTNIRFPQDVYAQLAERAKEQRRSINQAVVVAVERYLRQTGARQPKEGKDAR
jgi:hypothetical protein